MSSDDAGEDPKITMPAPELGGDKERGTGGAAAGDPKFAIVEQTKINAPAPAVFATLRQH